MKFPIAILTAIVLASTASAKDIETIKTSENSQFSGFIKIISYHDGKQVIDLLGLPKNNTEPVTAVHIQLNGQQAPTPEFSEE